MSMKLNWVQKNQFKLVNSKKQVPEGVVVAIICNIDSVGMTQLAFEIAKKFESVQFEQAYGVKKVYLCWSTNGPSEF